MGRRGGPPGVALADGVHGLTRLMTESLGSGRDGTFLKGHETAPERATGGASRPQDALPQ
jgi:hypothetical protein